MQLSRIRAERKAVLKIRVNVVCREHACDHAGRAAEVPGRDETGEERSVQARHATDQASRHSAQRNLQGIVQ